MTTVPLTADNAVPPSYSIEIDGTKSASALPGKAVLTFGANDGGRRRHGQ